MKGGQYPDYTLRFYRNGKGRLPQKDVHEQAEVEGKVGYLKSALLHYPYSNFKHYVKKWNFYNNFFANQIKEEQQNKNILQKIFYAFMYLLVRPTHWFLITLIRHKGFVDGWQGFTFSLFSALRFPVSYVKYVGVYNFFAAVILVLAAIVRFYNFPTRWGLGSDDGRDALIALEALNRHQLPLMGPFSSAGPFVFGGIYYWYIMVTYLFTPFIVSMPWIVTEIVGVITVYLLMKIGRMVQGDKLAIIIGLLAASSPQLVIKSIALSNPTFVSTFCCLLILSFLFLLKKKKLVFALLMGISIGLAISFHYQSINLLLFAPLILLVPSLKFKDRLISFVLILIGIFIPLSPLLYWDSHQGFANTRNIMDYFLIGQYRLYVPNSWKLFIFQYIPGYWSFVVGVYPVVALLIFLSSSVLFVVEAFRKKLSQSLLFLGGIFFVFLFISRYYKGERSEGYLLYLLPFVLLLSSWLFYKIIEFNNKWIKIAGAVLLVLVIGLNATVLLREFGSVSPRLTFELLTTNLANKFPSQKFAIYDYNFKSASLSLGTSLVMDSRSLSDPSGMPIGFCGNCGEKYPILISSPILVYDLRGVPKSDLSTSKKIWAKVNRQDMYDNQVGWLNKDNLKSTFNLQDYIMERFNK